MKSNLIVVDRDGTLVEDEDYYLGSNPEWKSQIKFLPGVVEGIKILNTIPETHIAIITNQAGVALQGPEFDQLTLERAAEVNEYIMAELARQGAVIKAHFICPYVGEGYVKKSLKRGRRVNPQYVFDNHPDLKPNPGLIRKAAKYFGIDLEKDPIHVIGDRLSDLETALNIHGEGHLVAGWKTKQLGDVEKAQALQRENPNVYIHEDFLEAARYIAAQF